MGTILGSTERGDDRTFALGYLCILALSHLISAAACVHTIVDRWWRPKPSWLVFPLWLYWLVLVFAFSRG